MTGNTMDRSRSGSVPFFLRRIALHAVSICFRVCTFPVVVFVSFLHAISWSMLLVT